MAPKKAQPKKTQAKATAAAATPKSSDASNAHVAGQGEELSWKAKAFGLASTAFRAAALAGFCAFFCNVSLLNMSPVYGQIPASVWHHYGVVWPALFIGWGGNLAFRRILPVKPLLILPIVAIYVPMVQFYMFRLSDRFSADVGAAVTEAVSLGPLVALSSACIADILEAADTSYLPKSIGDSAPGVLSYVFFRLIEWDSMSHLTSVMGASLVQSRIGYQLVLAGTYAFMARSKYLILGAPALLHVLFSNTHVMTSSASSALNLTLHDYDWSLVDRGESVTGYISILDNHKDGYRVMRCDHSLLGGEWTKYGKVIVAEPIYSVFTQLEAVRLVEVPDKASDSQAKALNIGLGIGTTPSALIAHGIDTTIVEIDPLVYEYAQKYFGLPSEHTAVIDDVFHWLAETRAEQVTKYDYIIHDVFTGGAEPIDLFTEEFMLSLNEMLKPNGVIAINFAGDFDLPPLSIVVNTVKSVFPTCRVFRESEPPSAEMRAEQQGRDFDNVIIFCTKVKGTIDFRDPTPGDYLRSIARQQYLMPKHEVPDSAFLQGKDIGVLRQNETEKLAKWHQHGALGHWKVMRGVLPHEIWENW